MCIRDRTRMKSCCDQTCNMSHIYHQISPHLVCNLTEFLKIYHSGVGACSRNDQLRPALFRDPSNFLVIDHAFLIDTIRCDLKIFSGHIDRRSMRQVTAMIQVHSHHFISRSEHCKLHCHIRLCPGVRLHIDIFTAKQLFRTLNRQILCHIYTLASAIITFSRIPFRIFVRERTSHRCHHCFAHPVF